jgi:rRNA 2'-O-methyltransferase fibrillarin
MAKKRPNVVPIVGDARHPMKYRQLVGPCDVIFSDVAQPDQARIVALNAAMFLKTGGSFMVSIKASCVDSTAAPESVYAMERERLKKDKLKCKHAIGLEGYHRGHQLVVGQYRKEKAKKD